VVRTARLILSIVMLTAPSKAIPRGRRARWNHYHSRRWRPQAIDSAASAPWRPRRAARRQPPCYTNNSTELGNYRGTCAAKKHSYRVDTTATNAGRRAAGLAVSAAVVVFKARGLALARNRQRRNASRARFRLPVRRQKRPIHLGDRLGNCLLDASPVRCR
jgi:hypothetical protein